MPWYLGEAPETPRSPATKLQPPFMLYSKWPFYCRPITT